jgi:predicted aspartyl protease
MGTFYTDFVVANVLNRAKSATVSKGLVDTGSERSWVPAKVLEQLNIRREKKDLTFEMANGQTVTRSVGFAIIEAGQTFTIDEVVFGEPGDMTLLGARTLEGLNFIVDPSRKKLVAAGPQPAARGRKPATPKRRKRTK